MCSTEKIICKRAAALKTGGKVDGNIGRIDGVDEAEQGQASSLVGDLACQLL